MGKQITITDPISEKEYTLEYNRKSAKAALRDGFDPDMMTEGNEVEAMLMIPILFNHAFDMHHSEVEEKEKDAIYEMIPNKLDMIGALAELFADPIDKLTADPKGAKSKNFKWKKTW